jgi:hypothetical protein
MVLLMVRPSPTPPIIAHRHHITPQHTMKAILLVVCVSLVSATQQWAVLSFYTDSNCSGTAVYVGAGPIGNCEPIQCIKSNYLNGYYASVCEETQLPSLLVVLMAPFIIQIPLVLVWFISFLPLYAYGCTEIAFFDYFPTNTCISYGQFVDTIFICNGNTTAVLDQFSDSKCANIKSSSPSPVLSCSASAPMATFCRE